MDEHISSTPRLLETEPNKHVSRAQIRMEFIPSPRTNSKPEIIEKDIENVGNVRLTSKMTIEKFGNGDCNNDLDLELGSTGDEISPLLLSPSSADRLAVVKFDKNGLTDRTSSTPSSLTPNGNENGNNIENEEFPRGLTFFEPPDASVIYKENNFDTISEFSEESEIEKLLPEFNNFIYNRRSSLITDYDEFVKCWKDEADKNLIEHYLEFAEHQEECRIEWLKAVQECRRLRAELDKANHEIGDFQVKLKSARNLLDQERKLRKKAEEERKNIEQQMYSARDLLFSEKELKISDDTKEKLSFLNNSTSSNNRGSTIMDRNMALLGYRLDTISEINSGEINSTGSLLSDFSCSRSDAEIDNSIIHKMKQREWKAPIIKKNKSPKRQITESSHKIVEINPTDKIVATTTLQMTKDGPITATSVIEAVPQSESESSELEAPERESTPPREEESPDTPPSPLASSRSHNFFSKTIICPEMCAFCQIRIRFGKIVVRCKDCRSTCHVECKNLLGLPCIPLMNIPSKCSIGSLSDYTPNTAPMVPPIIVHCINEIESRGLKEVGLYRVPGVEKDIKSLKDKLLKVKSIPHLRGVDIHVLCGVVKDFLRNLKEPLVTYSLRKDFIQASEAKEEIDAISCLYQAISQLPQPNRDTLSYVMLHLNRVAASRDCRMPSSNLSKIFGPTLIGYSQEVVSKTLLSETSQQNLVMTYLMKIPIDFWSSFVIIDSARSTPRSKDGLRTPSSTSTITKYFTPSSSSSSSGRKRKKYFGTPPICKK